MSPKWVNPWANKPCGVEGHTWSKVPIIVHGDGARTWQCIRCTTACKTPGRESPTELEKVVADEVEAFLKLEAEK